MFTKLPVTSFSNFKFRKPLIAKDEVPQKDVQPHLKPWEKFDWPPERKQQMYLEWGVHCSRKQQPDRAESYYERSIDLRNTDADALFYLSKCRRQLGKNKLAYENSLEATMHETHNPKIDREFCRSLFELNEFEVAKAKACRISQKYVGSKGRSFLRFAEGVDDNIKDCFGDSFTAFLLRKQNIFQDVIGTYRKKHKKDPRPVWKVLKEQGKCDVVSILEKEVERLHPREVARRKLASKVYHQVYLPNSWKDATFLRSLEEDNDYLSPVFTESTPTLRKLLKTKNEAVKKFTKMLHARSPLYNEFDYKIKYRKMWEKTRENHLYRVQYQTRRTMYNILRTIRQLRKNGAIEKLAEYVEKVMGEYIIVKTHRVAPWQHEFLNEVYNTFALALADKYVIPPNLMESTDINALEQLFNIIPVKDTPAPVGFVFGNRATQINPNAYSQAHENKRKFLERMEKRLYFAKEPIEKAYIYHEVARAHLKTSSYGECEFVANKGVKEATQSNNPLWALHCTFLIVKANILSCRREKCNDALDAASAFAFRLHSWLIADFIDLAKIFNNYKIARYKSTSVTDSRKSKSKSIDSTAESLQPHTLRMTLPRRVSYS